MRKQPPTWLLQQFPLFIRGYKVQPHTYVHEGGIIETDSMEPQLFMFVGFRKHCKWCGQRVPTYVEVEVLNG